MSRPSVRTLCGPSEGARRVREAVREGRKAVELLPVGHDALYPQWAPLTGDARFEKLRIQGH